MKIIMGLLLLAAFAFGDDHGNSISTATTVGPNSTTAGNIAIDEDVDFFKVVLPSSGHLEVYTSGSTDTYGYLFDSAGRVIADNDDSGTVGNFKIVRNSIAAGTYYIKVRHYAYWRTGRYTLYVRFTSDIPQDDHGNSMSSATTVDLNSVTNGNIEIGGDVDFFKIVLPSPGILTIETTGHLDTYGYLYRANGTEVTHDDDNGGYSNFIISRRLASGTYYVKVKNYNNTGTGTYRLHIDFTPGMRTSTANDDHGNSISTATMLPSNGTGQTESSNAVQGDIEDGGDVDFFQITVPTTGILTVYTTGDTDTYGDIFDTDGSPMYHDDDSGQGDNFKMQRSVATGTYYIKVRHFYFKGSGRYMLHMDFSAGAIDDYGNSQATATIVEPNSVIQGNIYAYADNDLDYFRVQVPSSGTLTVYTTGSTNTQGSIIDGSSTYSGTDGGTENNFRLSKHVVAKTYYIEVRHDRSEGSIGTGDYSLHVEFTPDSSANHDDHGNDISTATSIGLNSVTQGNLALLGDLDYFKVEVPTLGTLTVYTTGNTDTFGYIVNERQTRYHFNDNSGEGSNFRISKHETVGIYYIEVKHSDSGGTGHYALHVDFTPDVVDDHGDDISTATTVGINSTTRGNLDKYGDLDFFKIIVPSTGTLIVNTVGTTNTYGYLLREDGSEIAHNDDSPGDLRNFKIQRSVTAGTYYVKVRHRYAARTGSYTLYVSFRHPESESLTPTDDHANTPNTAEERISLHSTTSGNIEIAGDNDYFLMRNTTGPGTFTIYTTGSTDTYGSLLALDQSVIAHDDNSGEGNNFRISVHVTRAGTFFVGVRHSDENAGTGAYTLHVEFTRDPISPVTPTPVLPTSSDDHGDIKDTATIVGANSITAGNIETGGDEDYFKVVLQSSGTLLIYTTSSMDTVGYLYTIHGSLIAHNDDNSPDANFRILRNLTAGTYYIKVRNYYSRTIGRYSLHMNFTPDSSGQQIN